MADQTGRLPLDKQLLIHLDPVLAAIAQIMIRHPEDVQGLEQIIFFIKKLE